MRLAGIEKAGYFPYLAHMAEDVSAAALPGLSRLQRAHVGGYSTLAPVKVNSPASWARLQDYASW